MALGWNNMIFSFRTYDAQIGRFMQIDPVAFLDANLNPYGYANNNPILYFDPFRIGYYKYPSGQQTELCK